MGGVTKDVRFALRGLRRRPGFAAVAVLTIALGIGAASAVFAVVDAVVFRPLPYPEPDALVAMWTSFDGQGDFGMSLAEHYDYAEETLALTALGSFTRETSTLTGLGEARRIDVAWTWGDLFEVIGAEVALGRLPSIEDARSGAARVAVVSHEFWVSALSGERRAIGRTLELDQASVEVIGVMRRDVRLPTGSPTIWRPIARDRADIVDRSGHSLEGIGRLAPGASVSTLRAEIEDVHERWHNVWAGVHSPGHPGHSFATSTLHDRYFGELRAAGTLLLVSVLLVLMLACANVASLLLARGEGRAADLALRRALGAGRIRIIRQLLVESLVLSVFGGALGLVLAAWGADALMAVEPGNLPRVDTIGLDPRVTLFAVSVTLLSGVVFGVLPALRSGSVPVRGGRGSAGPDRSLSRSLSSLVVGQVALAIVLLAGAGLLTRSVQAIASTDAGISTESRLTFQVALARPSYPTRVEINEFWGRLLAEIDALPGVEETAVVRRLPLRDNLRREGMRIEGREVAPGDAASVAYGLVTPRYFSVMDIPVVAGREFEPMDDAAAPWVGLVNESAARAFWPGTSPLGKQVYPLFMPESAGPVTIVGVVGDVRAEGVRADVTPELYLSYAQVPSGISYLRTGAVVARTTTDPVALLSSVRGIVERLDPQIPLTGVSTLDGVAEGARARERFLATVLGVFAGLALVIAALGTYGVVAYTVARRTREFGVRIALGAPRDQVVVSVLLGGARLAFIGGGLGLLVALAAGPVLDGLIFGIGSRDATALAVGPAVMGLIVMLASLIPALRASSVSPLEALRDEA